MMTRTEKAIQWMEQTAENSAHGYDQLYRWGEKGDYDCSSAVITAWQEAGVPVKTNGATYTGNMKPVFLAQGFNDVTKSVTRSTGKGLKRGDVLLNTKHHVAMYCGDGKEVEASVNEKGKATGGVPGDQTGREFLIRPYRNFPWDTVLRYNEDAAVSPSGVPKVLRKGDTGEDVKEMQTLLIDAGYSIGPDGADGDFGSNTLSALLKFQAGHDLIVDGEYGDQSREALTKAAKMASPAPSEWVGYVTAKSGLNIRSSAEKTSDNILYAIVFGSKVTVFGKSGGWLHVHVSGRSDGWCSSEFISNGK